MTEELVRSELVDGVAVISFARPERHNALNNELTTQWWAAMTEALRAKDVRCLLLRGDGPSFSSGRDTTQLGGRDPGVTDWEFVREHQQVRLETLDSDKPVVAALKGYVFGGAFEVALSADMRVASTDTVFAFPEVGFGLAPDTGGSQLLLPLAGPAKTKYLLMTGDRLDAATAERWGIVDWLLPPEEVDDFALNLAKRLAAAPRTAVASIKLLVDQAWAGAVRNGIRQELLVQSMLFAGEEHRETKAERIAQLAARKERT